MHLRKPVMVIKVVMQFTLLKKHLSQGNLSPCYVLHGDDDWVINTAWGMFDNAVDSFPEFNIEILGEGSDIRKILEACLTLPMMAERRLVKADKPSFSMKLLQEYLSNPAPSTVLVLKFGAALPKDLTAGGGGVTIVNCNRLDRATMTMWVKREAEKSGAEISNGAAALLFDYCLDNMSRISTETVKLAAYRYGGIIEPNDVEEFVTADAEHKIFALTDAMTQGNPDLAFDVLNKLLADKNQPIAILGLMYSHYRRLLHSAISGDDPDLYKYLGVKEGAVRIAQKNSKKYSKRRLYDIVKMFHQADFDFKNGGLSGRAGLEKIVAEIIN